MESIAKTTIRQSSKKVRFVLDEIRSLNIDVALAKLSFMNKKAAYGIHKTISSAINNLHQSDEENGLKITRLGHSAHHFLAQTLLHATSLVPCVCQLIVHRHPSHMYESG